MSKYLFADTETTGLVNPKPVEIFCQPWLEVGELGRSFNVLIHREDHEFETKALEMAHESGLYEAMKQYGVSPADAFKQFEEYLKSLDGDGWILSGSDPGFDVRVLKNFCFDFIWESKMHYRTLDVNTVCYLFSWEKDKLPRKHRAEDDVNRDIGIWERALKKVGH